MLYNTFLNQIPTHYYILKMHTTPIKVTIYRMIYLTRDNNSFEKMFSCSNLKFCKINIYKNIIVFEIMNGIICYKWIIQYLYYIIL